MDKQKQSMKCKLCNKAVTDKKCKYCLRCQIHLDGLSGRDKTREMVRIKNGHKCELCKKKWKLGMRRFDIHHAQNDLCGKKSKGYDRVTEMEGLQVLCHKCHLNLHSVRRKMMIGRKLSTEALDKQQAV